MTKIVFESNEYDLDEVLAEIKAWSETPEAKEAIRKAWKEAREASRKTKFKPRCSCFWFCALILYLFANYLLHQYNKWSSWHSKLLCH